MTHEFQFQFKKKKPLWKEILLFFALVFLFWGGIHTYLNFDAYAQITHYKLSSLQTNAFFEKDFPKKEESQVLNFSQVPHRKISFEPVSKNIPQEVFREMDVYPSDNRIFIPRIDKNVPLITVPNHNNWNQLEKNIQKGLRDGAVVHPISREPGQNGNFFITGHSSYYKWDPGRFKDIFALLHEVNIGDIVEVYWDNRKYSYKIKAKEVVPPTATQILNQPDDISIITLMTCTPVGTNKNRLVLMGDLVKDIN